MTDPVDAVAMGRALDVAVARAADLDRQLADAEGLLLDAERRAGTVHTVELEREEARIRAQELAGRIDVLEADKATLEGLLDRARRVHDEMTASVSWRSTSWLRHAARIARRRRG